MKKIAIVSLCSLLFCGGLFCLHLVAQSVGRIDGALVFDEPLSTPTPLSDRNLEECSERELLELKVTAYQLIVANIAVHYEAGALKGGLALLCDSQADLAAAEIELYRHTGEQDKLRQALQAKVGARKEQLEAVIQSYEAERIGLSGLSKVKVQLIDALLEQKREK